MSEDLWIRFDRSDPKSFPPADVDVIVETENGQTFPARFIQKSTDFSLRYALWGNQGRVTRWRHATNSLSELSSLTQLLPRSGS
jgi:hypothetical protein